MAKQKLELDRIKLDSELDFDFNMDDIDGMINPDAKKPKKRSPVSDVVTGTIAGAKSRFRDPSFIAKVTRDALPEQYGEIFDTTDKVSGALSSLYDESIRELKPELARVAKKVDRLVPEESKFFKKLSAKFSELMGNEVGGYKGPDAKQLQEQSIQTSIAAVFKEQADINVEEKARDSAQGKIDRVVDQKRFTTSIAALRHIDQGVSRLAQYNDKVTQAYQKKSLELQYRSFFVQNELLDVSKRYYESFKVQNESIVKNTALPEFVKITDSERFKDQLKTKLITNVQKSLFGDGDIINTAIERLKKKTKESVYVFKQALEAGSMGLDEVDSMREMQRMMAESGIEGDSAGTLLGNVVGSQMLNHYGNRFGKHIRSKLTDDTKVGQFGYKAASMLKNFSGNYEKLRNSAFLTENAYAPGIKGVAAKAGNVLLDLIRPEGPDLSIKDSAGLKGINDIVPGFTNKAMKSLTDVIPGYLARIYREVASIRSGKEVDMVSFDYSKDRFLPQTTLSKDIKDVLNKKANSSFNNYLVNNAISNLTEGVEVDDNIKEDFGKIIRELARQRSDYSAESVSRSDVLAGNPNKELFNRLVANKTSTSKGQYEFSNAMVDVKNSFPNLMQEIDTFVKAGYGDILEEQGLLKRKEDGSLEVDIDAYKRLLDDNIVSSDINVKRNISSISPKDALEAVKKTKIYNWFYKLGKGDQQPHTGPMAQDVNNHLGEEAAPGGTKIDLTTMNGVNMAAIQALKDEHDQSVKSDKSQSILDQIKTDTGLIVELMQKGSSGIGINKDDAKETLSMRKGFYTSIIEPVIQGSFKAISGLFGTTFKTVESIKDNAINPFINFVTKGYKDNKTWIHDSFKDLFKGAGNLATKVFDFGKNVLFDVIPDSVKTAWTFGGKIKDQVKHLLSGPVSIYLKGDPSHPLLSADLMKMGYYFDQITGKVIQSIEDIKGPVIDKTGEVVLTTQHIMQGLVDKEGKEIKTAFEKLVGKALNLASSTYTKVKDFYGNLASIALPSRLKNLFSSSRESSEIGGGKSYDVLVEIRDLIKGHLGLPIGEVSGVTTDIKDLFKRSKKPAGGDVGEQGTITSDKPQESRRETVRGSETPSWRSLLQKAKPNLSGKYRSGNVIGTIGSLLGGFKDKASAFFNQPTPSVPVDQTPDVSENQTSDDASAEAPRRSFSTGRETWNDRDGSGKRDGDWRDRLANAKKKTSSFLKADLKEKYRGENVIDMIGNQAKKLLGFLTDNAGSLFSKVGSIAEVGLGSLGLGKLGSALKGIPGKVLGMGSKVLGMGSKAAGAVMSGVNKVSKIGGVLKNAKTAFNVAKVARIGLGLGSLMSAGTASTLLAGASTAVTALAGTIASPVVLGVAATAAIGYGAYKAYQYATRDNVTPFESLRLKQYGLLNSEYDKHHNHELLNLEAYLQDGKIGYDEGKAYLLAKKIDVKEMLSIFSIDENDDDQVNRFSKWFELRFKPFFLNHMTVFYRFNNKGTLKDVVDLSIEAKSQYLNLTSFESGPYDITVSPFKDLDQLNTDPKIVTDAIQQLQEDVKKEIKSKSKKPMDVAAAKMAEIKANRDPSYWKKKAEENAIKTEATKHETQKEKKESSRSAAGILLQRGQEAAGKLYDTAKQATSQAYESGKKAVSEAGEWAYQNVVVPVKDSLSGLIQRAESGSKGYNAYNRGTSGNKILPPVGPRNLTGMTISQILEDSKRPKDDPQRLFAVGKYQIIPTTMQDGVKKLGINPNTTLYNEPTQERLFSDYLLDKKRPKISAFIKGKNDDSIAALDAAASEWASLPDPKTGVSKYGHGNKSSVQVPTLLSSLTQSRELYKQYISEGLPEREAYQKAVSGGGSGSMAPTATTPAPVATTETSTAVPVTENVATTKTSTMATSGLSVSQVTSSASSGYAGSINSTVSTPKQSEPVSFTSVPSPSYTGTTSSGQGQTMALPGVETVLNHVGETLDKSLDVQQQMLGTLKEILANVNPDNIQQIQQGLKQVATQSKSTSEISKPAVDLLRKSA